MAIDLIVEGVGWFGLSSLCLETGLASSPPYKMTTVGEECVWEKNMV